LQWQEYGSHPLYLTESFSAQNNTFGNREIRGVWNHSIRECLTYSVQPYWQQQHQEFSTAGVTNKTQNPRILLGLSTKVNKWNLNANIDYGNVKYKSGGIMTHYHSWRMSGSISVLNFSVSALYQKGPYFIFDFASAFPDAVERLVVTPSFMYNSKNGKFQFNLSYSSNYYNTGVELQRLHNVNMQSHYRFKKTMLQFGVIGFQASQQQHLQFRLGIQSTYQQQNSLNNNTLKLFCFHDINSNGSFDEGESLLEGVILQLGGISAISDQNGRIVFKKIPNGIYPIQGSFNRLWSLLYPIDIDVDKHESYYVPFVQSKKISGRINVINDKFNIAAISNEGIKVLFTNNAGQQFSTLSLETGTFNINLPDGRYIISLATEGLAFDVLDNGQEYTVTSNSNNIAILFNIAAKKRPVEHKKY
jgi:hypothetical protein